jgi:hypothetical protein
MQSPDRPPSYDAWHYIGYGIALAIVIPVAWWVRESGIVHGWLAPFFGG